MERKIKPRRVAILAGNYQQYLAFCHEQGWPPNGNKLIRNGEAIQTVYCDCVERMVGWYPDEFIRTGTWYEHPTELIVRFDFWFKDTESRRERGTSESQRDSRDDSDNTTVGC